MRPELERLKQIEDYLHHRLAPEQVAWLEAQLLVDDTLRTEVEAQREAYRALQLSGRRQLRQELEGIHRKVYGDRKLPWFVSLLAFALAAWALWQILGT